MTIEPLDDEERTLLRRYHTGLPQVKTLAELDFDSDQRARDGGFFNVRESTRTVASLWIHPEEVDDALDLADIREAQRAEERRAQAAMRETVKNYGWTLTPDHFLAIPIERTVAIGPRTFTIAGDVLVPFTEPFPGEAEAAAEREADAEIARLVAGAAREAAELDAPDDEAKTYIIRRQLFARTIDEAIETIVRAYRVLTSTRLAQRAERAIDLEFYLDLLKPDIPRRFHYYAGPTNAGKTHAALEALGSAAGGVFLAPLRLLALEGYERLNERGVITSLVTGEERVISKGATHVSSTVEMVDLRTHFGVAVIDEAQFLSDSQRGWAWTTAIAGVRADDVILCGSPEGIPTAERLVQRLGGSLMVRTFERKSPLRVGVTIANPAALKPADAVIVFTRKDVIDIRDRIAEAGFTTAVIYGSLSPQVRRREAERFRTGEAQVLVATDAIGYGLNLPIRRIVFATTEKFDGIGRRRLTLHEVRQIAGRAGRYGMHDEGLVCSFNAGDLPLIARALEHRDPAEEATRLWIAPTTQHLEQLSEVIHESRLARLVQYAQDNFLKAGDLEVRLADLSEQIDVARVIEGTRAVRERLSLGERSTYARAPVNQRSAEQLLVLSRWALDHALGREIDTAELDEIRPGAKVLHNLDVLEGRARLATLYLWLSQRFADTYRDGDRIGDVRDAIDRAIENILIERGRKRRRTTELRVAKKASPQAKRDGPAAPLPKSGRRRKR
jgi:ATP-dependent RNA helicase SUPV3L1/SUV3